MSKTIRRHSIISSVVIYAGFAVGLLNTFFFTKEGLFSPEEYGLTSVFIAVSLMLASLSTMAMPSYIYKFYPYYKAYLDPERNDMLTLALVTGIAGFALVTFFGITFESLVVRKYSANSRLFVNYYYWVYPLAFGYSIFNILEAWAWNLHKSILTNFLKEVQWRLLTTILIVLFILKIIPDFDLFIKLYAFTYPGIAITLLLYLVFTGQAKFTFRISKVTKRFFGLIRRFCAFVYSAGVVFTLSQIFDQMVILSVLKNGLAKGAIFGFAQLLTGVIQAPQRGITAAAIPHLSQAWKDKKLDAIQTIYQRSSINLLIFACFIFLLIALNYRQAITSFGINSAYLEGFSAFILLGMTRVIDLGTGVNKEIIGTSNFWKFELASGLILLVFMLPLNYLLTKQYGIIGPAVANLISITIYNAIRIGFLWKKFKLFPFTKKSMHTVLLAAFVSAVTWILFDKVPGITGMVVRSFFAVVVFWAGVYFLKLTPDLAPVLKTVAKKLGFRKN
jgi:O-antigen/teichoic acid export membrane protein